MTFANARARDLWARTGVRVSPERLVLATLPRSCAAAAGAALSGDPGGFAVVLVERDEVSLTVSEAAWAAHPLRSEARAVSGPWRAVTLDLDVDLDVTGYLAPAAASLAAAGVPTVPQCAWSKDHLLVPEDRLDVAVRTLLALVDEARRGSSPA